METIEENEEKKETEHEYPRTIVYAHEVVTKPNEISVYDCRRIYKTQQEVSNAFRTGSFDMSKTMHIGPDGQFYFLQWKDANKHDPVFMENQRKLEDMLRAQNES